MKFKRIMALAGVVLLVGMYICTMIFALLKSPWAAGMFRASLYLTIVIPVIIYMGTLIFKNAKNNSVPPSSDEEPADAEGTAGEESTMNEEESGS